LHGSRPLMQVPPGERARLSSRPISQTNLHKSNPGRPR
jgi:hypothetical protein